LKKIVFSILLFLSAVSCFAQNECPAGTYVPSWGTYVDSNGVTHQDACFDTGGALIFPNTSAINGVQECAKVPGVGAAAKLINCIALLPAAGGIADARGFGATSQTINTQVDVGGTGKSVTLLINPATQFSCTENNPSNYCLRVWAGSLVRGEGNGGPGSSGTQANFAAVSPANLKGVIGNWPRDGTVENSPVEHLVLRSSTGSTISEGLLSLSGVFAGTYVRDVSSVFCGGGGSSFYITSPAAQIANITSDLTFENDNIDCGNASNSGHALEIIDGAAASGIGSMNFIGTQVQHSALSEIDINGNGSIQCGPFLFSGVHTESASGLGTTPPFISITDCHNITFDQWNTSGAVPTSGNLMTISQTAANSTHDIYIRNSRFGGGTNIVSSSVAGLLSLPFTAQADTAMSVMSWEGLALAPHSKRDINIRRLRITNGTALAAGNFSLSAGWGTTATVSSILGTDQAFDLQITSSGTGQAANPTATLTFVDGSMPLNFVGACTPVSIQTPQGVWIWSSVQSTLAQLQFLGTPVAGNSYRVHCLVIGR